METEKDLNAKIMLVTIQIQEKHPELVKFLIEMPVTIPNENNPEITITVLKNYYNSLTDILKKYGIEHTASGLITGKK